MKEKQNKLSGFDDLEAEEVEHIEEGKYKGTIINIERDNKEYDYTRYKVKFVSNEDTKKLSELSFSFPTRVTFMPDKTPSSQHAKFLVSMGISLEKGVSVSNQMASLINSQISFLVEQKTTDKGTFSEIVKTSVKPI